MCYMFYYDMMCFRMLTRTLPDPMSPFAGMTITKSASMARVVGQGYVTLKPKIKHFTQVSLSYDIKNMYRVTRKADHVSSYVYDV